MTKAIALFSITAVLGLGGYAYFTIHANQLYLRMTSPRYIEMKSPKLVELDKQTLIKLVETLSEQHKATESMWRAVSDTYLNLLTVSIVVLGLLALAITFVSFKPTKNQG